MASGAYRGKLAKDLPSCYNRHSEAPALLVAVEGMAPQICTGDLECLSMLPELALGRVKNASLSKNDSGLVSISPLALTVVGFGREQRTADTGLSVLWVAQTF